MRLPLALLHLPFVLAATWVSSSNAQPLFYAQFDAVEPPVAAPNAGFGVSAANLGDLNGDGWLDFAVVEAASREVHVYSGQDHSELYSVLLPPSSVTYTLIAESLGDITGDGLGDLAVGDAGDEERVYLLSGADGALVDVIVSPTVERSGFGTSLARLDDIDEDGVADLAIGAPRAEVDEEIAGKVFIVSGSDGSSLYDLSSPNPEEGGSFGASIGILDDVNGEGQEGVIVGAPFSSGEDAGRVYVYESVSGDHVRTLLPPSAASGVGYGWTVEGVGDLDGDGRGDVMVGAPYQSVGDEGAAGRVYAVASSTWEVLYEVTSHLPSRQAEFGATVERLNDVDGDGVADVAVGEPGASRAYVVSGTGGGLIKVLSSSSSSSEFGDVIVDLAPRGGDEAPALLVSEPGGSSGGISRSGRAYVVSLDRGDTVEDRAVLTPLLAQPRGGFGSAVAVLDDVNGDGHSDYLVGAGGVTSTTGENRAYVIDGAEASLLYLLEPPEGASVRRFGSAVAAACDLDGDGVGDALVGADDGVFFGPGSAYVMSGATSNLVYALESPNATDGGAFGASIAAVPDVDGDGRCDVLVGAPLETGAASSSGRAYLFSGETGDLLRTLDSPSADPNGGFGIPVVAVGDLNGDGASDLAIGAQSDDGGRVYVFDGRTGELLHALAAPHPSPFHFFGASVAGLGDVDGDGVPDVLVGAAGPPTKVRVFNGADGTMLYDLAPPDPDPDSRYGEAVAVVGDLDGDGVDDFAVADPHAFGTPIPGAGAGRAYVHSGADGTVLDTLASPLEGEGDGAGAFARSIASAEGLLMCGAPNEGAGNVQEAGRAYVFQMDPRAVNAEEAVSPASEDGAALELYPNPAWGSTTMVFNLAGPKLVHVEVFDMLGRRVAVLHDDQLPAGEYRLTLDGAGLPAGVYVVRATGEGLDLARRVTLVR